MEDKIRMFCFLLYTRYMEKTWTNQRHWTHGFQLCFDPPHPPHTYTLHTFQTSNYLVITGKVNTDGKKSLLKWRLSISVVGGRDPCTCGQWDKSIPKCDVICENLSYRATNIEGPGKTARVMCSV